MRRQVQSLKSYPMSLPEGFTIRRASTADMETLLAHRRAMFHDMGYNNDDVALDSMSAKFRVWLLEHMNAGDYHVLAGLCPRRLKSGGRRPLADGLTFSHDWAGGAARQQSQRLDGRQFSPPGTGT